MTHTDDVGTAENERDGSDDYGGAIPSIVQRAARDLIAEHGVTQAELGRRLGGMSQSGVSQMLNTRPGGLSVMEMIVIELACDVRVGTVLQRAGVMHQPQLFDVLYELGLSDRQVRLVTQLVMELREEPR